MYVRWFCGFSYRSGSFTAINSTTTGNRRTTTGSSQVVVQPPPIRQNLLSGQKQMVGGTLGMLTTIASAELSSTSSATVGGQKLHKQTSPAGTGMPDIMYRSPLNPFVS